jgi:hypothetical protein
MADLTTVYSGFRGVDFRGEDINLARSSDSLNMWKDYREIESIRTRPTMQPNKVFNDTVWGIFFYKSADTDMKIIHSGDTLYRIVGINTYVLKEGVNKAPSNAFVFNDIWYFIDGKNYLQYDGNEIKDVVGYVPTTTTSRTYNDSGKIYEDVNLLSDYRKNSFIGDETATTYQLDVPNFDDEAPTVLVDGVEQNDLIESWDASKGTVTFKKPIGKPLTTEQDNIVIQFKKHTDGAREKVSKCTLIQLFDNRVFFSGNPDRPNNIIHCSLNEPTYVSDLDSFNEGLDSGVVKGMVAGNDTLWVFKEPSQANTTVFYHRPVIDQDYGKVYPSVHSSISTGCIGKAINFNDDIIFFSDRGAEGINGDITTEQVIAHRSTLVDRRMTAEKDYANMILEEWEGYLVVIIGNKVYLADSRAMFTNENHYEYEWFYWELEKKITSAKVHNRVLWLGTEDGLYRLVGNGNIHSYWETPKNRFNHPQRTKTTNKRGSVVEAEGDISVSVKTEKTEYEHIGDFNGVKDYFVMRIKRKKFKDLQIKFESNTHFSLESATLECYVGGYIKR